MILKLLLLVFLIVCKIFIIDDFLVDVKVRNVSISKVIMVFIINEKCKSIVYEEVIS